MKFFTVALLIFATVLALTSAQGCSGGTQRTGDCCPDANAVCYPAETPAVPTPPNATRLRDSAFPAAQGHPQNLYDEDHRLSVTCDFNVAFL
ncbi:hypothetical protein L596_010846 [Steinernema carpocapsae]|uniref:Uncharacterized protein n=1 Tax=Steinernema carpocapsae TaxID=34508 RepID=A0A4U5PKB8_STECR|nr:hypothetical protein L596_010846 [Steinernema carpocapsae]